MNINILKKGICVASILVASLADNAMAASSTVASGQCVDASQDVPLKSSGPTDSSAYSRADKAARNAVRSRCRAYRGTVLMDLGGSGASIRKPASGRTPASYEFTGVSTFCCMKR